MNPVLYSQVYEIWRPEKSWDCVRIYLESLNFPEALSRSHYFDAFFRNERLNDLLLRLELFKGVWRALLPSSLDTLSDLLHFVPNELIRALERVVSFWERLADLCDERSHILEDTDSADRIEGLWPAQSLSDDEELKHVINAELFQAVKSDKIKKNIQKEIRELDHRVPSLGLVIRESGTLQEMVKNLLEAFERDVETSMGILTILNEAHPGQITELQYCGCFLAAARMCSHKKIQTLRKDLEDIFTATASSQTERNAMEGICKKLTFRRDVSTEIWQGTLQQNIENCLHVDVFQASDSHNKETADYLPMVFLLRDFFRCFFVGIYSASPQPPDSSSMALTRGSSISLDSEDTVYSVNGSPHSSTKFEDMDRFNDLESISPGNTDSAHRISSPLSANSYIGLLSTNRGDLPYEDSVDPENDSPRQSEGTEFFTRVRNFHQADDSLRNIRKNPKRAVVIRSSGHFSHAGQIEYCAESSFSGNESIKSCAGYDGGDIGPSFQTSHQPTIVGSNQSIVSRVRSTLGVRQIMLREYNCKVITYQVNHIKDNG